jgi:hypothetical protein
MNFCSKIINFVHEKLSFKHERGRKQNGVCKKSAEFITAEKEPVVSINSVKSNNVFLKIPFVLNIIRYKYYSFAEFEIRRIWSRLQTLERKLKFCSKRTKKFCLASRIWTPVPSLSEKTEIRAVFERRSPSVNVLSPK